MHCVVILLQFHQTLQVVFTYELFIPYLDPHYLGILASDPGNAQSFSNSVFTLVDEPEYC